jgi:DNA topoisomerase IB
VRGNTPAVARRSYIDPRIFDRYRSGSAIAGVSDRDPDPWELTSSGRRRIERAVLDLLA